jgi:hypothetical protein
MVLRRGMSWSHVTPSPPSSSKAPSSSSGPKTDVLKNAVVAMHLTSSPTAFSNGNGRFLALVKEDLSTTEGHLIVIAGSFKSILFCYSKSKQRDGGGYNIDPDVITGRLMMRRS